MDAGRPLVSVLTASIAPAEQVERAIRSVAAQAYRPLEHVIARDPAADPASTRRLQKLANGRTAVPLRVLEIDEPPQQASAAYRPARASHARLTAARAARGDLLAFLDDDNEFDPDHLSSLVEALLRVDAEAAHSWRRLLTVDGDPYQEPMSPWATDEASARREYELLVAARVWLRGTNLLRDSLALNSVDTSSWLVRRELLERVPLRLVFTPREQALLLCEDVAFCRDLKRVGARVISSESHTLRYYLGGYTSGSREYLQPTIP